MDGRDHVPDNDDSHTNVGSIPYVFEGFVPDATPNIDPRLLPQSTIPQDYPSPPNVSRQLEERGPGGWNRGMKLPPPVPHQDFTQTHNNAIAAFVAEDYELALQLCREAISLNPEVYAAHSLLARCLQLRGENENAVEALFLGANACSRNAEAWNVAAEAYLDSTFEREHALKQAGYCYTKLLDLDSDDSEYRFKRATMYRQQGYFGRALGDLDTILRSQPFNPSVLRVVAEVCVDAQQIHTAKKKYEEFIEYSKTTIDPTAEILSWSDINVYVELYAHCNEIDEAILQLKSLSRWLLGRDAEVYWDALDSDDCEWDGEDEPRRVLVPGFQPGQYPSATYGDGLPLELRVKLGVYRLRQGRDGRDEAFRHFEWLEPADEDADAKVNDYPDLFLEAAFALRSHKEHDEALRYLEPLKRINALQDADSWLAIGDCYYVCERKDEAVKSYEWAKVLDPNNAEARTQLSKLYTDLGDREKALRNGEEAVTLRRKELKPTLKRKYERKEQRLAREAAEKALRKARKIPNSTGLFVTRFRHYQPPQGGLNINFEASRLDWQADVKSSGPTSLKAPRPQPRTFKRKNVVQVTKEEREKRAAGKVANAFEDIQNHTEAMRRGESFATRKWMTAADTMIAVFRTNRALYPSERNILFQGFGPDARTIANKDRAKPKIDLPDEYFNEPLSSIINKPAPEPESPIDPSDIALPSIESTTPTDYRSIAFTIWLDIFLELALLQVKQMSDDCYGTILAAVDCTVFYHSLESMFRIHTVYFICALTLSDSTTLFNTSLRWFMRQYQFNTEVYRLFAACNLFLNYPADPGGKESQMLHAHFRLGPSQKFLFRQIKQLDASLPQDYGINTADGPVPAFMREALSRLEKEGNENDEEEDPRAAISHLGPTTYQVNRESKIQPKEMDVVLLTLYAHVLYCGGSFPNALSYLYRAYTLDRKNPAVLLTMSLSYIHQMAKRQNEDRHTWLLRGLAFFEEYADARIAWAREKDEGSGEGNTFKTPGDVERSVRSEIAFNRGRLWQMLGMADLAAENYQHVLKQNEHLGTDMKSTEEFSHEAAYALQVLYAMNGDTKMAKELTEKYLVVE